MIPGVTVRKEVDEATGVMGTVVIEHKEDLHPQIVIVDDAKEVLASYSIPAGAHIEVKESSKISAGTRLARTPRKIAKTKDITGGLPRVAELFEAAVRRTQRRSPRLMVSSTSAAPSAASAACSFAIRRLAPKRSI